VCHIPEKQSRVLMLATTLAMDKCKTAEIKDKNASSFINS
jgi:hypothetical protein